MTEVSKAIVKSLVDKWSQKLGLSHYQFRIHLVKPEDLTEIGGCRGIESDYAQVITSEEKQEVDIYFNERYLREEPKETENTVVHELLHVLLNDYQEHILDIINSYVSDKNTREMLSRTLERKEHQIVVRMVRSLLDRES
jgi:Zn-dependent peptidase ImmA (M78 family)